MLSSLNCMQSKELAQAGGTIEDIPRRAGRQTLRDNMDATTPEEYWRRVMYYPFVDHFVSELEDRLLSHDVEDRLQVEHILPRKVIHLDDRQLAEIASKLIDVYESDLPDSDHLIHELKRWRTKWIEVALEAQQPDDILLCTNEHFYPNIHTLLKLLLVLPISTATSERTFSSLRILKTWLRSTMGQERLSGLALMYIHRNMTEALDNKDTLQKWYLKSNRRIELIFED